MHEYRRTDIRAQITDAGGKELLIEVDQGKIHSPGMASLQRKIRKVHDHKAGVKYVLHDIK